jgi:hypothetical protein
VPAPISPHRRGRVRRRLFHRMLTCRIRHENTACPAGTKLPRLGAGTHPERSDVNSPQNFFSHFDTAPRHGGHAVPWQSVEGVIGPSKVLIQARLRRATSPLHSIVYFKSFRHDPGRNAYRGSDLLRRRTTFTCNAGMASRKIWLIRRRAAASEVQEAQWFGGTVV